MTPADGQEVAAVESGLCGARFGDADDPCVCLDKPEHRGAHTCNCGFDPPVALSGDTP